MSSNNLLDKYASLSIQISKLSDERDAIKQEVLNEVLSMDKKDLDTPLGKFSLKTIKSWTYPEYVSDAEENFKEAKARAQEVGDAVAVETKTVSFTSVKL